MSVDGTPISSAEQFVKEITSNEPGDVVTLVVSRDGEPQTVVVGLGSNPNEGPSFGKAYLGARSGEQNSWRR